MRLSLIASLALAAIAACAHAQPTTAIPASYPEGPLWSDNALYYAEMGADRVSVYADGRRRTFFTQPNCGPTALAPYGQGFLILCHIGARVVAVDADGRELRRWDRDTEGRRLRDPNDVSADGRGGVYFSDPGNFSRDTRPHGYVMHLSADGALTRVAGPLWYPNGVFVDVAHNTLYVNEHMTAKTWRFDIGADSAVSNQAVFADLTELVERFQPENEYAEAGPDGIEIGPNGDFYIPLYGEGRILRLSPRGVLVDTLETPGQYVTNIAFGPEGQVATTATFENLTPPFPGEVRFFPLTRLTRTPD